jgi:hypothetical protein
MQTLGVSDSTPQSDGRLKNIFWPTIRSGTDVDTLGSQGFWICVAIAVLAIVGNLIAGRPIAGVFLMLYYYLGGVGVRQQSCFAAVVVFVMFALSAVASPGILNFFGCVLLLSVLRATFIASFWEKRVGITEMPARFNETWGDKFADTLPAWLWPKIRIVYYIYSIGFLALITIGFVALYVQHYYPGLLRVRR